ncbi:MAG: cobalt ECF transporter T component CbiQ [Deltaproteobacteria bacterium]|nr:cobalt ECF transporter T component CbiQ [Deltaproteobacteria bacterium]
MFDLFSDIFAARDNVLTRIDPRPKLVLALAAIMVVVVSRRMIIPGVTAVSCLLVMVGLRIPLKLILRRLVAPLSIVLVIVALHVLLVGHTPLGAVTVFKWRVVAYAEGLDKGLLLGLRVLGAVSVMLLLSSVTPAHRIFHALRFFHIPEEWVEVALLVYRYTFTLVGQTSDVAAAQKVRLGYSSFRRAMASIGLLAGTVMARSMDQAFRTHEAMVLRGYEGRIFFSNLPALTFGDRLLMCLGLCFLAGCYLLIEI